LQVSNSPAGSALCCICAKNVRCQANRELFASLQAGCGYSAPASPERHDPQSP